MRWLDLLFAVTGWVCFYLERRNFKSLLMRVQLTTSDCFEAEMQVAKQKHVIQQLQLALNDSQKQHEVMSAQLESFIHGDQKTS